MIWLKMPVLVLAAEFDYFHQREARVFYDCLPDSRCRIFDAAHHHLPLERPEEFNRNVMEFLVPGASNSQLRGAGSLACVATAPPGLT